MINSNENEQDDFADDPIVQASKAAGGNRKSEDGGQKTEVGSRKSEVGGQKTDDGKQKSEEGSQKSEEGSQKSEEGSQKADDGKQKAAAGVVLTEDEKELAVLEKHFGVKDPVFLKSQLEKVEALETENKKYKSADLYEGLDDETKLRVKFVKAGGDKKTFDAWYPLKAEELSAEEAIVRGKFLKIKSQDPKSDITLEDIRTMVKKKYKANDPDDAEETTARKLEMAEDAAPYREYLTETRKKVLGEDLNTEEAAKAPEAIAAERTAAWQPVLSGFVPENSKITRKVEEKDVTYNVPDAIIKEAQSEVLAFIKLEDIDPDTKNPKDLKVIQDMFAKIVKSKSADGATDHFLKMQKKDFIHGKHNPKIRNENPTAAEQEKKKKDGKKVVSQLEEAG